MLNYQATHRKDYTYRIINVDNGVSDTVLGSFGITENIEAWELASTDACEVILYSKRGLDILQAVRDYYGRALEFNSGFREPSLEVEVNGSNMEHPEGKGWDVWVRGVRQENLAKKLAEYGGYYCNVGQYDTYCHFGIGGFHRRKVY